MKQDCPFCSTNIDDHVFLKSSYMLAVYNIAPILPGHSMVIPRRHVETIFELTGEELAAFFKFSMQVTQLLMKVFDAAGFDWSLQESEAAGQSVAHLHLHIIPRKANDLKRPGEWYALLQKQRHAMIDSPDRKKLSPDELISIVTFIKKHAIDHAV